MQPQSIIDIQSLIDRVRIVLARERYEESAEIRQMAQDLCDHVRQVNERLQRCGEYLRNGLRAEAIHEADTDPRLLDCLAVLEGFSDEERKAWGDVCEFLGLPVPDPLLTDLAIMMDEAYGEQEPLTKMLREHRRLALQRAPLAQRLKLLRRLAKADQNTEHWSEDLRRYEQVRLDQMNLEVRKLKKSLDAQALTELMAEATSKEWICPVPDKLKGAIRVTQAEAVRLEAREEIENLAGQLHQAYSAMNFPAARSAYAAWQATLGRAELKDDDPLVLQSLAALAWCDEQLVREQADAAWKAHVYEAESAADDPRCSQETLIRLIEQTTRLGQPLPPALDARLRHRLHGLQTQTRRRQLMMGLAAAGGTTLIAACVIVAVLWSNEVSHRRQIVLRIREFVKKGDVNEAEKLAKQFENRWQQVPEWIDAVSEISTLGTTLKHREESLNSILDQSAVVEINKETQFEQLMAQAGDLTNMDPIIPTFKQQYEQRSRTIRLERQKKRQQIEQEIRLKIDRHETAIVELERKAPQLSQIDFPKFHNDIRDGLQLLADTPGIPSHLSDGIKLHQSRLQTIEREKLKLTKRQQLYTELYESSFVPAAARNPGIEGFVNLLNRAPDLLISGDPLIEELRGTSLESGAWKSLYAVQQALPSDPMRLFPTNSDSIKAKKAELKRLIEQHQLCPISGVLNEYLNLLEVLEKRRGAVTVFQNFLKSERMKDLLVVRDETLDWPYYVTKPDELSGSSFQRWRTFGANVQAKTPPNKLQSKKPLPAPQIKLAAKLNIILADWKYDNWEEVCDKMIQETLQKPPEQSDRVDPLLKLDIADRILEMVVEANPELKQQQDFQDLARPLHEARVRYSDKAVDWGDPANKNIEAIRKDVDILEQEAAKKSKSALTPPRDMFDELRSRLQNRYEVVGFLWKHDDHDSPLKLPKAPGRACQLLLSIPSNDVVGQIKPQHFEQIGELSPNGTMTESDLLTKYYRPGRLVFTKAASN